LPVPSSIDQPRVLIADDERETCILLRALLMQEGIDVVGMAHGGVVVVAMVAELVLDVVLMDFRMPDMSGMEATERIKIAAPDIQVIFLTFYGDDDWKQSAEQAGAYCYLLKGCPPAMIVDMIWRAWRHRQEVAGGPTAAAAG